MNQLEHNDPAPASPWEARFHAVFDNSPDVLMILDSETREIMAVNQTVTRLLGYPVADLLHQPYTRVLAEDTDKMSEIAGWIMDDDRIRRQNILRAKGGVCVMDMSVTPIEYDGRDALLMSLRDVTERSALEQQLQELAQIDSLTGAFNRRYFMILLDRQFAVHKRYRRPLSVATLDLDHFKEVNDTFGHQVGDEVLRQVARTCREYLREADIFGRVGGEEFGLLLPETDCWGAVTISDRLRRIVSELRIPAGDQFVAPAVSIGVAECTSTVDTPATLWKWADLGLYEAKRRGRNQVQLYGLPEGVTAPTPPAAQGGPG